MAFDAGQMTARLTLNAKQFSTGIHDAQTKMTGFQRASKIAGIGLKAFGALAAVAAAATTALGISAAKTAGMFETFEFQLKAVSKSTEEAVESMKMIRAFAERTPFYTDQVVQAFVQLKAVGIDATEKVMQTIGDVAFTMNRDIRDVASGLISFETEVLRRLGIQIDRTGQRVKIMSGDIRIETDKSAESIRRGLLEVWEKRFPNAMSRAESTWKGLTAIFASGWQEFQATLGQAILPSMKEFVKDGLIPIVTEMRAWVTENQELIKTRIDAIVNTWIPVINAFAKSIGGVILKMGELHEKYLTPPTNFERTAKKVNELRDRMEQLNRELKSAEGFKPLQWIRPNYIESIKEKIAGTAHELQNWEMRLNDLQQASKKVTESVEKQNEESGKTAKNIGDSNRLSEAAIKTNKELEEELINLTKTDQELLDIWKLKMLAIKNINEETVKQIYNIKSLQIAEEERENARRESEEEFQAIQDRILAMSEEMELAGQIELVKQQGMENLGDTSDSVFTKMKLGLEDISRGFSERMGGAIADVIMEGKNLGEVMKAVFKAIVAEIIKTIVQALILKAILASIKGPLGLFHEGGMVMHKGGVIPRAHPGLMLGPEEVPIIAQRGEAVLSRDRGVPAIGGPGGVAMANAGIPPGPNVTFNIETIIGDDDWVQDHLMPKISEAVRLDVGFQTGFTRE